MPPRYHVPGRLLLGLVNAILFNRPRSFRQDACTCIEALEPPARVYNRELIPQAGPCLVTVNHYSRPGFRAWWFALGISAAVHYPVHWTVTAAWTYPDRLRSATLTPLTRWALHQIARVYGFTTMPPMPPDPAEALSRAEAVRRVLAYARHATSPVIGLAPEGMDFEGGKLGFPPPGTGRFMLHLASLGLSVLPVGAFEDEQVFCLRFGPPYALETPPGLAASERDRYACQVVIGQIARLLPPDLRGAFAENQTREETRV
jgi:hypothetical protein